MSDVIPYGDIRFEDGVYSYEEDGIRLDAELCDRVVRITITNADDPDYRHVEWVNAPPDWEWKVEYHGPIVRIYESRTSPEWARGAVSSTANAVMDDLLRNARALKRGRGRKWFKRSRDSADDLFDAMRDRGVLSAQGFDLGDEAGRFNARNFVASIAASASRSRELADELEAAGYAPDVVTMLRANADGLGAPTGIEDTEEEQYRRLEHSRWNRDYKPLSRVYRGPKGYTALATLRWPEKNPSDVLVLAGYDPETGHRVVDEPVPIEVAESMVEGQTLLYDSGALDGHPPSDRAYLEAWRPEGNKTPSAVDEYYGGRGAGKLDIYPIAQDVAAEHGTNVHSIILLDRYEHGVEWRPDNQGDDAWTVFVPRYLLYAPPDVIRDALELGYNVATGTPATVSDRLGDWMTDPSSLSVVRTAYASQRARGRRSDPWMMMLYRELVDEGYLEDDPQLVIKSDSHVYKRPYAGSTLTDQLLLNRRVTEHSGADMEDLKYLILEGVTRMQTYDPRYSNDAEVEAIMGRYPNAEKLIQRRSKWRLGNRKPKAGRC